VDQCWPTSRSDDGVNEIHISPIYADPVEVLDTLVHELVHAVDDCKNRHGAEFKKIALAVGLQGRTREASAGALLKDRLQTIASVLIAELGPYPHARLSANGDGSIALVLARLQYELHQPPLIQSEDWHWPN
jgi:hypothetical protein